MVADAKNDFVFESISINKPEIRLSDFKGSVVMVVNTASKCGFTKQLKDLEEIYNLYKGSDAKPKFVVIGVPSNDFKQEFADVKEVAAKCEMFNVTYLITKPYSVKGENAHPFFKHISDVSTPPKWNFYKYLLDKNGNTVEYYTSFTNPSSSKIKNKIEELLKS